MADKRLSTLTTPNPGGGAYTHSITLDGNSNMIKTVDFKSTAHYYAYDELNRMSGHGASSSADDETYAYACCGQLTAYTDARGTAAITYDDLGRTVTSADSNGNQVSYEYDALSRVAKLTPPQGTNYRTEYTYKKNGSLSQARVYDAGSAQDVSAG